MARIIKNQKGADMNEFSGYLFTKKYIYNQKITWRCRERSCRADKNKHRLKALTNDKSL